MFAHELSSGRHVSWDLRDGAVTVRITCVHEWRICYVARDGVPGMWEATCFHTLDYWLRNLRPATADEASEFARLFQPAPVNYY